MQGGHHQRSSCSPVLEVTAVLAGGSVWERVTAVSLQQRLLLPAASPSSKHPSA
jgi:hypothetical protein